MYGTLTLKDGGKRTIWKYTISRERMAMNTTFDVPTPGRIVEVRMAPNGKDIDFWVEFNPGDSRDLPRTFTIIPTGSTTVPGALYCGTAFDVLDGNQFVWHLYEIANERVEYLRATE